MNKLFIIVTLSWLLHAAEQKLTLPDLLKQHPEQESYGLVDWRQRFRQKYLLCEYEPLKSQLASIAPCLMQHIKDQQWDEIFKDFNPPRDQKMHDYMNLVTTVAQKINHTQLLQEIKKRIGNDWHLAARYGFVALINEIISPTTIDSRNSRGETALHCACEMGHAKAVRALLAAKATVDSLARGLYTPLMVAARAGHVKCCQLLLEANANVNVQLRFFGSTPLFQAAGANKSDVVQLLLDYKADVNIPNRSGYTPLIIAAVRGRYECVLKLIQAGADMNAQNWNGRTALDEAKDESIKILLIQAGAKKSSSCALL